VILFDNGELLVIVINIWQKLSIVEREVALIVANFWQLFSQIFGETLLVSSSRCSHDILFRQCPRTDSKPASNRANPVIRPQSPGELERLQAPRSLAHIWPTV
jgi:hypothetical protein